MTKSNREVIETLLNEGLADAMRASENVTGLRKMEVYKFYLGYANALHQFVKLTEDPETWKYRSFIYEIEKFKRVLRSALFD